VLMVLAFVLLSEITKAWLLYLGLVFLFMVMYAPGGIASLIMMNLRVALFGKLKQLLGAYFGMGVTLVMALFGAASMIEMVYHLQLGATLGSTLVFLGLPLDSRGLGSWLGSALLMFVGLALFELVRRRFALRWNAIQEGIELEMRRREAAQ